MVSTCGEGRTPSNAAHVVGALAVGVAGKGEEAAEAEMATEVAERAEAAERATEAAARAEAAREGANAKVLGLHGRNTQGSTYSMALVGS